MILDLSQFMSEQAPIPENVTRPNKLHYPLIYEQFMADPMRFPYCVSHILKGKLMLINYLMDQNLSYQYFIENCFVGTIKMACWMCQFQYGDKLYIELRKCFVRMVKDIRYLIATETPERAQLHQNQQQFDSLINSLKIIQLVRLLQGQQTTDKYKQISGYIEPSQIKNLEESFLYNIILVINKKSKYKMEFEQIQSICSTTGIFIEFQEIDGIIQSCQIENLIYDILYENQFLRAYQKREVLREVLEILNL